MVLLANIFHPLKELIQNRWSSEDSDFGRDNFFYSGKALNDVHGQM